MINVYKCSKTVDLCIELMENKLVILRAAFITHTNREQWQPLSNIIVTNEKENHSKKHLYIIKLSSYDSQHIAFQKANYYEEDGNEN